MYQHRGRWTLGRQSDSDNSHLRVPTALCDPRLLRQLDSDQQTMANSMGKHAHVIEDSISAD